MNARFHFENDTAGLTVTTGLHDGVPVVALAGEVDQRTAPLVEAALTDQLARASSGVIVDLRGVTGLGSAGITVLVDINSKADNAHVRLAVVADQHAVVEPLEISGCGSVLHLHRDVSEAVRALT
jgi:anti-anti-sigma factor